MLIEAIETVHTTGINWDTIATVGGMLIAGIAFIDTRANRKTTAIQSGFQNAIEQQTKLLEAKLETKETVSNLNAKVARLEQKLDDALQIREATQIYVREASAHSGPVDG